MTAPGSTGSARRRGWLRIGLPVLVVLVAAGGIAALALNRGDGGRGSSAAGATSSAAASSAADASGTAPASPTPVTEPSATAIASRPGVPASARTVAGATAPYTAPASWADGASVTMTGAHQQVTGGQGPGVLVGQPQTVFQLSLTNGSSGPLDLGGVVVQARYGSDGTVAGALYDGSSVDFSGTLAPGATATAVYSFAIPDDQLENVRLSVDIDGRHFPAVFTGAVPIR